jgi:hypothetical protein
LAFLFSPTLVILSSIYAKRLFINKSMANFRNSLNNVTKGFNTDDLQQYGVRRLTQMFSPTGEPQRAYMWEVKLQGLFSDEESNLTYYAESISLPEQTNEIVTSNYMDKKFDHIYTDSTERTVTINFWDSDALDVYRYFEKWRQVTAEPDNFRGVPHRYNYKRNVLLILKDNTDFVISGKIELEGAIIESIGSIELDYENNDVMKFPVTLRYNKRYLR